MSTRRSTRTILLLSLGLAALATASCSDDVYWEHWHHPDPDDGWRPVGTPGNPPCDGHHPGGPNGGGPNGGGPNGGGPNGGGPNGGGPNGGGPGGPGGPPGPGGSGADAGLGADGGHAALDGGGLAGDAGAGREDGGALADAGGGGAGDAGPGCNSDTDCAPGEICTTGGVCVLPACGNLHTESACLGRHDCVPIYAGMNCRDQAGSQCVSGESGCICATYSFVVCVGRQ